MKAWGIIMIIQLAASFKFVMPDTRQWSAVGRTELAEVLCARFACFSPKYISQCNSPMDSLMGAP